MHNRSTERYNRQTLLRGFGMEKQELLFKAKVLVIDAGGLGCPALIYLAAAGIGQLGIVDFDSIEISNLHRQILYNHHDIGKSKAEVAAEKIKTSYPDTEVTVYNMRLIASNTLEIIEKWDVVIDGSDNFPTRYLVNDACVILGKPLVYGSVDRYEGQVAVFNYKAKEATKASNNYRDLFPTPPPAEQIPNCDEAGVLGVLPGIIGGLMTNEAIKIITGIGEPLANKLLTFNSLNGNVIEFETSNHPEAIKNSPVNKAEFQNRNYELQCGNTNQVSIDEITCQEFDAISKRSNTLIVDVRNKEEKPKMAKDNLLLAPLPELENYMDKIAQADNILVFCQSGMRSIKAAQVIRLKFNNIKVYSLKGGINEWAKYISNKK